MRNVVEQSDFAGSNPSMVSMGDRHVNEVTRLYALQQLDILDTPPSANFDRITRLASKIFDLPIAAMSLTDNDRQWFKSRVGIDHMSIPREKAPCAQVAETAGLVVIPDLLAHPYYSDSNLAKSGIRFYAGAPLVTADGHGLGALCVLGAEPRKATTSEIAALTDLASLTMAQIELEHAFGRIDPISGLPNQTQFDHDLEDLARDNMGQRRLAILIDLAHHEQINALMRVMGAGYLENIVKEAGRMLRIALGNDRKLYHVATTQFAFLSPPEVDEQDYIALLCTAFVSIRKTSDARFVTTLAVGVMPFQLGSVTPRNVLRAAQSAAQDSHQSDGSITVYRVSNDILHRRQFALLNAFGAALEEREQLRIVFQPRIDLASRRCIGAEALLRWRHPTLGDVSPAEFIPVIEQTPAIKATTARVLDLAFGHLSAWRHSGFDMTLSVNVSVSNLEEAGFVEDVRLCLERHGVPPDLLEIEVTESTVMENSSIALRQLKALTATGVKLAIDDFGTGYSSISYLQKLPAHVVKIDRSFITRLSPTMHREQVLVKSMIDMSHSLGFRVVAEGVETAEAADLLSALGCEEAQGYFFGRPLEAVDFLPWVTAYQKRLNDDAGV